MYNHLPKKRKYKEIIELVFKNKKKAYLYLLVGSV